MDIYMKVILFLIVKYIAQKGIFPLKFGPQYVCKHPQTFKMRPTVNWNFSHLSDFQESDPYSSLIWFTHGAKGTWGDLKKNLDDFLAEYEPGYWANAGASQTKCLWDSPPRSKKEACEFNKEWLSDQGSDFKCISEENYGYHMGQPCLLLKLNRVYGWAPQPYFNVTEVEQHPEMPSDLKRHIRKTWEDKCRGNPALEDKCPELNIVWLHCDGELDPDKENIG